MINVLKLLGLCVVCIFHISQAGASCLPGQDSVTLFVNTGNDVDSLNISIFEGDSLVFFIPDTLQPNRNYTFTYCTSFEACKYARIEDFGTNTLNSNGFFVQIQLNTLFILTHVYLASNRDILEKTFDCSLGSECLFNLPLAQNDTVVTNREVTWYAITPSDTGIYELSSCFPQNLCDSKLWIYLSCSGNISSSNVEGALAFNDNFDTLACLGGAVITSYLYGGRTYFVRLEIQDFATCSDSLTLLSFIYKGPVQGCMDPIACNYSSLAVIPDTCFYSSEPECLNVGPDLTYDYNFVSTRVFLDTIPYNPSSENDSCTFYEGCFLGAGNRLLFRFPTIIRNIGNKDFFIGNIYEDSLSFTYDNCHGHAHYENMLQYDLYDQFGNRINGGSKDGFCLGDSGCDTIGSQPFYSCETMGISAGCYDIYNVLTQCQWLDITGIDTGTYTFQMTINPNHSSDSYGYEELDYSNNSFGLCLKIYEEDSIFKMQVVESCYTHYDCNGELWGTMVNDCEGVCGGQQIYGDVNHDAHIDALDLESLMDATIQHSYTLCSDLNEDGVLNPSDIILLENCNNVLHNSNVHVHQNYGALATCNFPFSPNCMLTDSLELDIYTFTENPDLVKVSISNINQLPIKAFSFMANEQNQILSMSGVPNEYSQNYILGDSTIYVYRYGAIADEVSLLNDTLVLNYLSTFAELNSPFKEILFYDSMSCLIPIKVSYKVDLETNIHNVSKLKLQIYPNPTYNHCITLQSESVINEEDLIIHDLIGNKINYSVSNSLIKFDNQYKGVFILKYQGSTQKIVSL